MFVLLLSMLHSVFKCSMLIHTLRVIALNSGSYSFFFLLKVPVLYFDQHKRSE